MAGEPSKNIADAEPHPPRAVVKRELGERLRKDFRRFWWVLLTPLAAWLTTPLATDVRMFRWLTMAVAFHAVLLVVSLRLGSFKKTLMQTAGYWGWPGPRVIGLVLVGCGLPIVLAYRSLMPIPLWLLVVEASYLATFVAGSSIIFPTFAALYGPRGSCGFCKYDLTGMRRPMRCPECGARVRMSAIAKRIRQRWRLRATYAAIPTLGLGLSLFLATGQGGRAQLAEMLPTGLLASLAAIDQDAAIELAGRRLEPDTVRSVARDLARRRQRTTFFFEYQTADWVAKEILLGTLDKEFADAWFADSAVLRLELPKRAAVGQPVAAKLAGRSRPHGLGFGMVFIGPLLVDGVPVGQPGTLTASLLEIELASNGLDITSQTKPARSWTPTQPSRVLVELPLVLALGSANTSSLPTVAWDDPANPTLTGDITWSQGITLRRTIEVVP
ncbi:MAG: hypothetical protein AAF108_00005 [Planctomycetota bacterium]